MNKLMRAALLAAALLSLTGTVASAAGDIGPPVRYENWLEEVAILMSPPERKAFLALHEDSRRDAFIAAFWKARDPDPAHPDGSFRATYYARREGAKAQFGSYTKDAAKVWILNGEPLDRYQMDCGLAFWPLEIWYYRETERMTRRVVILFYRPAGGPTLVRWHPQDGTDVLMAFPVAGKDTTPPLDVETGEDTRLTSGWNRFVAYVKRFCQSDEDTRRILTAVRDIQSFGKHATLLAEAPPPADPEWLETFAAGSTDAPAAGGRDPLSPEELHWLDEVALLMTGEERRTFLALPRSYQRSGFIEAFWRVRDPYPNTPENEGRAIYGARLEAARERWKSITVDQARVYVINGEPGAIVRTDCNQNLWPLEIWRYTYSDRSRRPFELIFYQRNLIGPYRLWHADDGYGVLQARPTADAALSPLARPGRSPELGGDFQIFYGNLKHEWCPAESVAIIRAMHRLVQDDRFFAELIEQPPPVDDEWLATFRSFSTELPGEVKPLDAELQIDFPSRHQSRTVVRGTLLVPRETAVAEPARGFTLTGEVLREDTLHESFRYYFQLASPGENGTYPLIFERFLRPGDFRLVLKLEDTQSGRAVRLQRDITVPSAPEAEPADTTTATNPAPLPGASAFRLLAPSADLASGTLRVDAEVGDPRVQEVVFSVDGKPILTKRRPPWSVELRLGELPRSTRVRAVAHDAAGAVIAEDELQLNPALHRFAVRLVEPREGAAQAPLRVRAEVQVPPDRVLDRVELFLDETPVATLFQEPWEAVIATLPTQAPTFLRAVGHLTDGTTAEDVVLLGSGETQRGAVDVDLVEVYTAALDSQGKPVQDLDADDFEVREDGRRQTLRRFQRVTDLPLQVGLLVDTSASMAETLPEVEQAALRFFREALAPGDRAAVLTFSDEPRLAAPFTRDLDRLGTALVGLQAARGTALWDSLVFALHYFQGTPGRRALLVFSDGADHGSRYTFDQALAYAQHSGVSVYAISFGGLSSTLFESGRRKLTNLAEATGGQSFVLGGVGELAPVYDKIEEDLRSQYLLVYQSDGQGETFRALEVRIKRSGVTARTMRGYLP